MAPKITSMVCPPERHIPVEFQEIYAIIKGRLSTAEQSKFEELSMLAECLYSQEFMVMKRNLKHNFLMFSVGAKDQALQTRVGRGLPTQAELDTRELAFVRDFMQLMAKARFSLLTEEEWDIARTEQFLVNLPVAVNWDFYDQRLLKTFWKSSDEARAVRKLLPKDVRDNVLVFHRGIGVAEHKDMFINDKIDLLVEYLVVNPGTRLWCWLRRKPPPKTNTNTQTVHESQHEARKVVERRTLKRLLPTAWSVIKNMHKNLKISEPSFKEVVVLYRAANKGVRSKMPVIQRPPELRFKDILGRRNIHIKAFHDIPMADIEVIFADKKVFLKPILLIQLVITVVGALVAAMAVLLQSKERIDYNVLWSALSLVGARCGQVWSQAQSSRSKTIQDMVNVLYDKTSDAQEGVLSMLMEDMAEQQLKEAVLAYTLLLVREAELTTDMLDKECESFLRKHFDISIDFAVEDALPSLRDWGLVLAGKHERVKALPVLQAVAALQRRWQAAYLDLLKPKDEKRAPLSQLLPEGADLAPSRSGTLLPSAGNAGSAYSASAPAQGTADSPPRVHGIVPNLTGPATPPAHALGPVGKVAHTAPESPFAPPAARSAAASAVGSSSNGLPGIRTSMQQGSSHGALNDSSSILKGSGNAEVSSPTVSGSVNTSGARSVTFTDAKAPAASAPSTKRSWFGGSSKSKVQ